jgi:hypothetical protein
MSGLKKKDNAGLREKLAMRRLALAELAVEPVVMETHAGFGVIWRHLYRHLPRGAAFDSARGKADILAAQRPTWSVYEGDVTASLVAGAASHLTINLIDLDPYGDPWPTLDAFLTSPRPRSEVLIVVVNDGLRIKTKLGTSWTAKTLGPIVRRFGNNLYPRYLEACGLMMRQRAEAAGYRLAKFHGHYGGFAGQMTHYFARMERESGPR